MKNEKLDLIYRDEALEVLCDCCSIEGHCSADGCAEYQKISKLTTVDAVSVVRCKDCKKWEYDENFSGWCTEWRRRTHGDHFCSCGERREGE